MTDFRERAFLAPPSSVSNPKKAHPDVSHHPTKFVGHRHCDSGDIMVLVSHVISQDHVTKWLCDVIGMSQTRQITMVQSLLTIATLVVEL